MAEVALLAAALVCSLLGFAWLALTMDVHWQQVIGLSKPSSGTRATLRVLGAMSVAASLVFALEADHPSIASLVWIMTLAAAALLVAFTLAWRPRVLGVFVPWVKASVSLPDS
jgi:Protein of unknown function (DUF3325)